MPLFLVVPLQREHAPLNNAVQTRIDSESDRFPLQDDNGWIVKYSGTAKELSDYLGISIQENNPGSPFSAIVVPFPDYYGRGPTQMWEWIKTRLEAE